MDLSTLTTPATPPYDHQHLHCERTAGTSGSSSSTVGSDHQASISSPAPPQSSASAATSTTSQIESGSGDDQNQKTQFHQHPATMPSPPELLHDSEEDEEDSLGSRTPTLHLDSHPHQQTKHSRKSVPHRSPPAVKDAIQASALDKSVVFQLDVRSHPFFPAPTSHDQTCPECKLTTCCGMACTTRIICGESLLTALRKRVAQARSEHNNHHHGRRRMAMHRPSFKRTRRTTHIEIPRAGSTDLVASVNTTTNSTYATTTSPSSLSPPVTTTSLPSSPAPPSSPIHAPSPPAQPQESSHHHRQASASFSSTSAASSGRPSRVKGPCQACRESSDGCMRKAFNWPFPTSSSYNDKGKPFVYLCNKCGLRYNKSGGCVCRHCRWVFCKEEKRKALQHIEQMIRSRPDGRVDPDEDIEGFVCSPKYWSCGRPWKVGWVLQQNNGDDLDEDALMLD